jgi:hypothetical protein
MPVDLEWPRRATVGAIAVIGVTRLASFAGGTGVLYCGERPPGTILQFNAPGQTRSRSNSVGLDCSVKSQTIALTSIHRQTPGYHSSIRSAKL